VFGIAFTEVLLIALVTLVVVGPERLPGMLRSLGDQIRRLRGFVTEMRSQSGIDDILRQEGLEGGLAELRSLMRGDLRGFAPPVPPPPQGSDPYAAASTTVDPDREYPPEGADAGGAIPDDLGSETGGEPP
jgi:sec-independent protein translocase protein TatB